MNGCMCFCAIVGHAPNPYHCHHVRGLELAGKACFFTNQITKSEATICNQCIYDFRIQMCRMGLEYFRINWLKFMINLDKYSSSNRVCMYGRISWWTVGLSPMEMVKIHLKATPSSEIRLTLIGLIKGHIEEEQFLLNQHNLSNFWIIYINLHFVPPKKYMHPLHPLQKKTSVLPTCSPRHPHPVPSTSLAQATGEVAVGHRCVEWRSEEFEVTAAADHRVQAQMHTVAAMASRGSSDGESGWRDVSK